MKESCKIMVPEQDNSGVKIRGLAVVVLCFLLFTSCGSKKVLATGEVESDMNARAIIKNHYDNQIDFETIRGRIRIDFSDGSDKKGTTVSLRIKKDEVIWLSAPLSVIKVMITPERVSFYNKMDNTFFDGDFSFINDMLGAELNFEMVQNLLLGQSIFNLRKDKYYAAISSNKYQLKPDKQLQLYKILLLLEPENFKMALQQLSQPEMGRILDISYEDYQEVEGRVLPNTVRLVAKNNGDITQIDLEYKNIEFNQKVTFPYEIPVGYKPVEL